MRPDHPFRAVLRAARKPGEGHPPHPRRALVITVSHFASDGTPVAGLACPGAGVRPGGPTGLHGRPASASALTPQQLRDFWLTAAALPVLIAAAITATLMAAPILSGIPA